MRASELRVGALLYSVSASRISLLGADAAGDRQVWVAGSTRELMPRLEALHNELSDGMAIARGAVPELRRFVSRWGASLLPPRAWLDDLDVLVVLPQGDLHGVPLHLVQCGEAALGSLVGMSYASSLALLSRCMSRNRARKADLASWEFEEASAAPRTPREVTARVGGVDVLGDRDAAFRGLATTVARAIPGDVHDASGPPDASPRGFAPGVCRMDVKAAFRIPEAPDVLCVVAHGCIDLDRPRMSGLLLARDPVGVVLRPIPLHGGRYFDFRDLPLRDVPARLGPAMEAEVLTSAELEIDCASRSELVALLGCSTCTGRVFPGDEPASLAESFLHIGTASVVASGWDVDLEFVRTWSEGFFRAWLHQRLPKALAFRHVFRQMQEGPYGNHPEQLGCMVLKGDWL